MPQGGAIGRRRQIAGFALARITKPHGHNRNVGFVVELLRLNGQPLAQAHAAGIIPGNTRRMYFGTGCLADNNNL